MSHTSGDRWRSRNEPKGSVVTAFSHATKGSVVTCFLVLPKRVWGKSAQQGDLGKSVLIGDPVGKLVQ